MKLEKRDIIRFLKFGTIGAFNTGMHSLVVLLAHGMLLVPVVASHLMAFCVANVLSYFLNSWLVFQMSPAVGGYVRFVSVSLFSLVVTITIAALCEAAGLDYRIGLVIVIVVAPPMTYLLQKRFTFRLR